MNNRIINDYHLHSMKICSQSKFLFFTIMARINIHLNARAKLDFQKINSKNFRLARTFNAFFFMLKRLDSIFSICENFPFFHYFPTLLILLHLAFYLIINFKYNNRK